uniref:COPA/B second beta-propeller domain-containing protein n=1 Tax=Cucumis melo TaxID=3656 RepID=A0A9I9DJD0_CUCME
SISITFFPLFFDSCSILSLSDRLYHLLELLDHRNHRHSPSIRSTLMMNPIKMLWSLTFNATSESKPHIQIPITPPPSPSSDLKHKKSVSIRRYSSSDQKPGFHPCPMEIGGSHGAAKFVQSKELKELNVGSLWSLIIKAKGTPGHGSRMYDNSAMENLMKSVEIISRFRESQFEIVKVGEAANSEVISVNPVFINAGIPHRECEGRLIHRIDVNVKNLYWADSGDLVAIANDTSFYILKYNRDAVSSYLDSGRPVDEQGVEDEFELLHEVNERARTGLWVTTMFHLNRPMYLLGYLASQSR